MTLPDERTRAVVNTRKFLRALLDPKKTPRIPRKIRKEAYYLLKHYPNNFDFLILFGNDQKVFGKIKLEDK